MNMKERESIINDLLEKMGYEFGVQYFTKWKNNGIKEGYKLLNPNMYALPVVYREEWFERSDDEVVNYLIKIYEESKKVIPLLELPQFTYEYISEHILPRVVSEINTCMLKDEDISFYKIENTDLLVVFVLEKEDEDGTMSVYIKNGFLECIGIDISEAYQMSIQNLNKSIKISSMSDVLADMLGADPEEFTPEELDEIRAECIYPMFVVSNEKRFYGASVILCPNARVKICEKLQADEFIIIPSSVHECIVIPNGGVIEGIKELVCHVNATQVALEDKLTDSVYICKHDKIEML